MPGRITVDGPLLRANGAEVRLEGINFPNYAASSSYTQGPSNYYAEPMSSYIMARQMGANVVRLGFDWWSWETSRLSGKFDPFWQMLDKQLDFARRCELYVIPTCFTLPGPDRLYPGSYEGYTHTSPFWSESTKQDAFAVMWRWITAKYRDNDVIAGWDFINEPTPPDGDRYGPVMQRLINQARQVGDRHVVFVENSGVYPMYPGMDGVGALLTDPAGQLAYQMHYYNPEPLAIIGVSWNEWPGVYPDKKPDGPASLWGGDTIRWDLDRGGIYAWDQYRDLLRHARKMDAPMLIGEYGCGPNNPPDVQVRYLNDAMDAFRSLGLHHCMHNLRRHGDTTGPLSPEGEPYWPILNGVGFRPTPR